MISWLDRTKIKAIVTEHLPSEKSHFLFTIKDSQEFEDISDWFNEIEDYDSVIVYLNTDSEVARIDVLEGIVEGFGKNNFPKFATLYAEISKIAPQIIIEQKIGTDINALKTDLQSNQQTVNLPNYDAESIRLNYMDSRIGEFLDSIITDLRNLKFAKPIILVIRFRGNGYAQLEDKFKGWFQDRFIRKIKDFNFRIMILCEKNAGGLADIFAKHYKISNLTLDDIAPITKEYLNDTDGLFCKGAIDYENVIEYKEFKIKLQKNISQI